eukprot:SAG11_NODE_2928_length_2831_cov_24.172767_2_plen_120_part_00
METLAEHDVATRAAGGGVEGRYIVAATVNQGRKTMLSWEKEQVSSQSAAAALPVVVVLLLLLSLLVLPLVVVVLPLLLPLGAATAAATTATVAKRESRATGDAFRSQTQGNARYTSLLP